MANKRLKRNSVGDIATENNNYFAKVNQNDFIVVLEQGKSAVIEGIGKIYSLCGDFDVHGFNLTTSHPECSFYSFQHHGLLEVKAIMSSSPEVIRERLRSLRCKVSDLKIITEIECRVRDADVCVALISTLNNPFVFLRSVDKFKCLHEVKSIEITSESEQALIFSDEYQAIGLEWENSIAQGNVPNLILCGGKNTGKSTLARYLVNRALNVSKQVAFLECDVGQTEFLPPGCVGLNIINSPVIGPPYSHQQKPEIMFFTALTNVALSPSYYFDSIHQVHKFYLENHKNIPLIVNTMGWNKGMGVSLLVETVKLIKPTMLLQLKTPQTRDNFPHMTPQFVRDLSDEYCPFNSGHVDGGSLNYSLHLLEVPFNYNKPHTAPLAAADYRNLSLISYFVINNKKDYQRDDKACSRISAVLDMPVYSAKFSDLALHCSHTEVPRKLILYAFNASLISLCTVDESLLKMDDSLEGCQMFVEKTPTCESLGLGIVHSICMETGTLNIATNLPSEMLERVNCLVNGAVGLPRALFVLSEDSRPIGMQYVDYPLDAFGTSSSKPKGQKVPRSRVAN